MMTAETTIRVEMQTNAQARRLALTCPEALEKRHNGGRIIVVTCERDDVERLAARFDLDRAVVSYEVKR